MILFILELIYKGCKLKSSTLERLVKKYNFTFVVKSNNAKLLYRISYDRDRNMFIVDFDKMSVYLDNLKDFNRYTLFEIYYTDKI